MKIKVDIFSGFLGAGKTRLIKKLIEENFYSERIAIVENEFGEVSIDGQILSKSNVIIKEINSGCICCQLKGDFTTAIKELVSDLKPNRIIIEPTGIAKLSDIIDRFKDEELIDIMEIDKVVTVVDGTKFDNYLKNFRSFFVDQIKATKYIIVSRCQFLKQEEILGLENKISKLNPKVSIVTLDWNNVNGKELMNIRAIKEGPNRIVKNIGKNVKVDVSMQEELKFETFAIGVKSVFSKDELCNKFKFISNNNSFGTVVRAKGIVEIIDGTKKQFDFSLGEFNIDSVNYSGDGVISIIGLNLNKEEIKKFFNIGG